MIELSPTRNIDRVLDIMVLKRSVAEGPDTIKKSTRNRYSLQQLSIRAKWRLLNKLSKLCCNKFRKHEYKKKKRKDFISNVWYIKANQCSQNRPWCINIMLQNFLDITLFTSSLDNYIEIIIDPNQEMNYGNILYLLTHQF